MSFQGDGQPPPRHRIFQSPTWLGLAGNHFKSFMAQNKQVSGAPRVSHNNNKREESKGGQREKRVHSLFLQTHKCLFNPFIHQNLFPLKPYSSLKAPTNNPKQPLTCFNLHIFIFHQQPSYTLRKRIKTVLVSSGLGENKQD